MSNEKAISASIQPGGYPQFNPERMPTADLGEKHEGPRPKISHDPRTSHILAGGGETSNGPN